MRVYFCVNRTLRELEDVSEKRSRECEATTGVQKTEQT